MHQSPKLAKKCKTSSLIDLSIRWWPGLKKVHYSSLTFRRRTPKPPTQNKERKKPEKRKPQPATLSDDSEEELESEVSYYTHC